LSERTRPSRRRRWAVRAGEALLFVGVFLAVHAWQTRGLIDTGAALPAPVTTLADLQGRQRDLREFLGRPVLVYFFAPWCGVCAASAGNLARLARWRAEGLHVVLVAMDYETVGEVTDYVHRHELGVPVLLGDAQTADAWRVAGYPTYYVLDGDGRVRRRDFGYSTLAGLWLRTGWLD
jgi:thiol-disulfide isomerase/thioredoxin